MINFEFDFKNMSYSKGQVVLMLSSDNRHSNSDILSILYRKKTKILLRRHVVLQWLFLREKKVILQFAKIYYWSRSLLLFLSHLQTSQQKSTSSPSGITSSFKSHFSCSICGLKFLSFLKNFTWYEYNWWFWCLFVRLIKILDLMN